MSNETAYRNLLGLLEKANRKKEAAIQEIKSLHTRVRNARGKLEVGCDCGHKQLACETKVSREVVSTGYEDYDFTYRDTWFCNQCSEEYRDFKDELFPQGIAEIADVHKNLIKWQVQTSKAVRDLRAPRKAREKAKRAKEKRALDIERAKRLLASEGITEI